MNNTIVRIFQKTDMRNQHDGLVRLALKFKVRLDSLGAGEHVIFLNNRLDKVKMFSANGVLSYYRAPGSLTMDMIEYIPQCFGANGMNWQKAERLALEKLLTRATKKGKRNLEPSGEPVT